MRYKNTLAMANISISIFPQLKGALAGKWLMVMLKWRRNDLALWKKFCLKKPTERECRLAAFLAEKLTLDYQIQFELQDRIFRTNRMNEYAYRAFPFRQ
jgi:hypothetical protein